MKRDMFNFLCMLVGSLDEGIVLLFMNLNYLFVRKFMCKNCLGFGEFTLCRDILCLIYWYPLSRKIIYLIIISKVSWFVDYKIFGKFIRYLEEEIFLLIWSLIFYGIRHLKI
jgi:hypothetical protein